MSKRGWLEQQCFRICSAEGVECKCLAEIRNRHTGSSFEEFRREYLGEFSKEEKPQYMCNCGQVFEHPMERTIHAGTCEKMTKALNDNVQDHIEVDDDKDSD